MELAWHLILRVRGNRVLARDRPERLHVVRTFARFGAEHRLLAFGLADAHVHVVAADERARLGRFCQRVGSSLQQTCGFGSPFGPAVFRPVESQSHLRRSVLCAWRQGGHHGLNDDPLAEFTNVPDLLGGRRLDTDAIRARAAAVAVAPLAGPERAVALRRLGRDSVRRLRRVPTTSTERAAVRAQLLAWSAAVQSPLAPPRRPPSPSPRAHPS